MNFLPKKKYKCIPCDNQQLIKRGKDRYSKRVWDGPFCTKCGMKLK